MSEGALFVCFGGGRERGTTHDKSNTDTLAPRQKIHSPSRPCYFLVASRKRWVASKQNKDIECTVQIGPERGSTIARYVWIFYSATIDI